MRIEIQSNQATGNWCYIVYNSKNEKIVATADRKLAMEIMKGN